MLLLPQPREFERILLAEIEGVCPLLFLSLVNGSVELPNYAHWGLSLF